MRLSQAVNDLVTAAIADGRSHRTIGDYQQKLQPLVDFLDDKPIEDVTTSDLRAYVAHLRTRSTRYDAHPNRCQLRGGLSEATVASNVRAVKRLFNFLHEEGVIAENPAARLKTPKLKRGEPKAMSTENFVKLLDTIEEDTVLARRDRALLLVLADTACRVGGLIQLRIGDLDLASGQLYLREKGNKGRYAFITPMTQEALKDWLEVRPTNKGDYLFVTLGSRGEDGLADQGVREVLRRLKRKAGVKGPVNPHAFRHAFAREYLTNGGDLASLADIMGHSDVKVTWASYAIYRTEELKAKHARNSPVAHLGQRVRRQARSAGLTDGAECVS